MSVLFVVRDGGTGSDDTRGELSSGERAEERREGGDRLIKMVLWRVRHSEGPFDERSEAHGNRPPREGNGVD